MVRGRHEDGRRVRDAVLLALKTEEGSQEPLVAYPAERDKGLGFLRSLQRERKPAGTSGQCEPCQTSDLQKCKRTYFVVLTKFVAISDSTMRRRIDSPITGGDVS